MFSYMKRPLHVQISEASLKLGVGFATWNGISISRRDPLFVL